MCVYFTYTLLVYGGYSQRLYYPVQEYTAFITYTYY